MPAGGGRTPRGQAWHRVAARTGLCSPESAMTWRCSRCGVFPHDRDGAWFFYPVLVPRVFGYYRRERLTLALCTVTRLVTTNRVA
jgi:hypothetical protein